MSTVDTLRSLIDIPEWMDDANCHGLTHVMYPVTDAGTTAGKRDLARAKAVCRRCDVQAECLAYAINEHENDGVWGGLAPRERTKVKPPTAHHLCGTSSGYRRHRRDVERACDPCLAAWAARGKTVTS